MARSIILLMDSFGVGASDDAEQFGDVGADTFGHIAEQCAKGLADAEGVRQGPLHIPNLTRLGLVQAGKDSRGASIAGLDESVEPEAIYGYAQELSHGKDTPSGHWEIAGVPVLFDWGYFPETEPCFPDELIQAFIQEANLPGVLGNKHASGTVIIEELGAEHIASGKPIVYTSADSVFQIAAHEEHFGLERLYEISDIARKLVDKYNIGRVIARPFIGAPGTFKRTGNRRDIATPPPKATLLDKLVADGGEVYAIGKIADIYAHQGISHSIKATGNMALFDATLAAMDKAGDKTLIFTNFVDFDMEYGHRRNVIGYAKALEDFDKRLPELTAKLKADDLVVISADHGCDPTFRGTDHTREHIPVIAFGPKVTAKNVGKRDTFADIGQSIAKHLGIPALGDGKAFI